MAPFKPVVVVNDKSGLNILCVCVCVCVGEREREIERKREKRKRESEVRERGGERGERDIREKET